MRYIGGETWYHYRAYEMLELMSGNSFMVFVYKTE